MIIPFQNIMQCFFGLLTKIKKGSGTSVWCTNSGWFFHKNVSYLILYQWPKFQHDTFFLSQDIKQNVLLSSYVDIWWHHKLKDLSWIKLLNNGWQGEKEEKVEIQKFEYLKNEKSFFNEIKDIFRSIWRPFIWWRIKIS